VGQLELSSAVAAKIRFRAAVFILGAAAFILLLLLAVTVFTALLRAALAAALLALLTLAGHAALLPAALLTLVLLALVLLALVLLSLVLLSLVLLSRIDILFLLAAVLLNFAGVGIALLTLLGLAAFLVGAAGLRLTVLVVVCHGHSPVLDGKRDAPRFGVVPSQRDREATNFHCLNVYYDPAWQRGAGWATRRAAARSATIPRLVLLLQSEISKPWLLPRRS